MILLKRLYLTVCIFHVPRNHRSREFDGETGVFHREPISNRYSLDVVIE